MSDQLVTELRTQLESFIDPHLDRSLGDVKAVGDIQPGVDSSPLVAPKISIELSYPSARYHAQLATELAALVEQKCGVQDPVVAVSQKISAHTVQKGVKRLDQIRNIIAVASGKGGVGKSTTSVNLALALASDGASVGMLDADIYGPSQPRMMNLSGQPDSADGKTLQPKINYGIQTMSMGFMVEEDKPTIWRGPMVTQALEQLLMMTQWDDLDYLIVDLPPGTGDTQLTLAQKVPVSGAVIVTTPQDIALVDARKGLKMFETVDVPVLGIVENMSYHRCVDCGREEHFFGRGGGQRLADEVGVELLGALPLDVSICEQADSGKPTVVAEPDSVISDLYRGIARRTSARLSMRSKDYTTKFPNIVIQNS